MVLLLLAMVLPAANPASWGIDGTPLVPRIMEIDRRHDPSFRPSGPLQTDSGHEIGDTINFWSIDHSTEYPVFYLTAATCRFVGEQTYIFVEDTQWDVHYDQEDVEIFAAALEDSTPSGPGGIVETDIDVFGQPPDAIDGDPKIYFLVLDIRDGFDPEEGGAYIAGFFSPYNQFTETEAYLYYGGHSNEVEMMYIDCFPSDADDASFTASHELVHLIHGGVKPFSSEELWVIENQAQSGVYVCGYPAFQVETFLEAGGVTPIKWTNLPWGSIEYVAGYGAGFLFFSYLYENYGGVDFLYRSLRTSERGISGVEQAIHDVTGIDPDMNAILQDWMLACWIDDPDFGNGKYGWEAFRIADYDTTDSGNRRGLDYTGQVLNDPYTDYNNHMFSYQGKYYELGSGLTGSFRATASGLGDLYAYVFDAAGGKLEVFDTGAANDVAVALPAEGTVLLLCRSFAGLDLDVSSGSVTDSAGEFAFYPQPCTGTLYFQFYSTAGDAVLSIFSLSGEHVESVNLGNTDYGETTLAYTGASSLASGSYFFRFSFGNTIETGSFTVVR